MRFKPWEVGRSNRIWPDPIGKPARLFVQQGIFK